MQLLYSASHGAFSVRRPIPSYVGQLHFLAVIHARDSGFSLRHNVIVVDVVGQQSTFYRYSRDRMVLFGDIHLCHFGKVCSVRHQQTHTLVISKIRFVCRFVVNILSIWADYLCLNSV